MKFRKIIETTKQKPKQQKKIKLFTQKIKQDDNKIIKQKEEQKNSLYKKHSNTKH